MYYVFYSHSEFSVKEAFDAQLQMVVKLCHKEDTLIVLGDFNATTSTDRDGYYSFLEATQKIRLKSHKMTPSNRVRLNVRRLRDESVAQEHTGELTQSLAEPKDFRRF